MDLNGSLSAMPLYDCHVVVHILLKRKKEPGDLRRKSVL